MTTSERPRIASLVLSELIDATPSRVRKRLEKEPNSADGWIWQKTPEGFHIACGDENVSFKTVSGVIESSSDVSCTCLLSPRCFHVLACASLLSPSEQSRPNDTNSPSPQNLKSETVEAQVPVTSEMRESALQAKAELAALLRVGGRRADLLRQSGILRAAHQCRATGLINLANALLGLLESIRRQRGLSVMADARELAIGFGNALRLSEALIRNQSIPLHVVGQARRQFVESDLKKLLGICAEPVMTSSGYAGIVVHFLTDAPTSLDSNQGFCSIHDVRPGDHQLIAQAYRGGIDMGNITLQAFEVCRSQISVQNLTVSRDGRLGKGTQTRWASRSHSSELDPFSTGRFSLPVHEQIESIFQMSSTPQDYRVAGWNLIAFTCTVLGPQGSSLIVSIAGTPRPWKLRIALDVPQLPFRDNLSLLARCPGLTIRCVGRVRLNAAGEVDLLAIAAGSTSNSESRDHEEVSAGSPAKPELNLPDEWHGLCNIGCDRLESCHVRGVNRWSEDILTHDNSAPPRDDSDGSALDGLEPLRRRHIAIALGGKNGIADLASESHRRDKAEFIERHQHTASEILDMLAQSAKQTEVGRSGSPLVAGKDLNRLSLSEVFLASQIYLHRASLRTQLQCWEQHLS